MRRTAILAACGTALLALIAASVGLLGKHTSESDTKRGDPFPRPAFEGRYVHDTATALGPFGETLERQAKDWDRDLGIEVQVVTVSAKDASISELGERIFQERKVGASAPTGGILLLLDSGGQRARIEVSYALEGSFPDAIVGQIADDQVAPYATYSSAGMALMDVLHLLKDYAFLQVQTGRLQPPDSVRARPAFQRALGQLSGGAGAQTELAKLEAARDLKAPIPEDRRARYAPSADPLQSVEAFRRVYEDLAGDPTLPLFTDGSQIQRKRYPVAPFEYWQRSRLIADSSPLYPVVRGDRAVVLSHAPAHGFFPILLSRRDGLWRVDLPEMWKNLSFGHDGEYFVVNRNNPYFFALSGLPNQGSFEHEPVDLGGRPLADVIDELEAALEKPHTAEQHFQLAELLFRNCFVFVDALVQYEEAARHEPDNPRYVFAAGDRALYTGFPRYALPFFQAMTGPYALQRQADAHTHLGEWAKAQRLYEQAVALDASYAERLQPYIEWARKNAEKAG